MELRNLKPGREKAMEWWLDLPNTEKETLADRFYGRYWWGLTGREIEKMYKTLHL